MDDNNNYNNNKLTESNQIFTPLTSIRDIVVPSTGRNSGPGGLSGRSEDRTRDNTEATREVVSKSDGGPTINSDDPCSHSTEREVLFLLLSLSFSHVMF